MQTFVPAIGQSVFSDPHTVLGQPSHKRRVIVADDDPLVRSAVRVILAHHKNFEIVGEAANGTEAIELASQTRPDLLMLDLNMPRRPGLSALNDLRNAVPEMRTILLTVSIERRQIMEALMAGARGIVLKEAARTVLVKAAESVMQGSFWVDDRPLNDVSQLVQELRSETKPAAEGVQLTPRESQVVEFVVEGCTNKDIAMMLNTSEQVIKNYLGKI